ncbi:hypothetical protein [Burkholderia sp. AU45388]|nr:hypothetical protein [Burkholderia sp. AU45388]MDN7424846.1 hypothetical protein [Burkholderia sp. AU45388]
MASSQGAVDFIVEQIVRPARYRPARCPANTAPRRAAGRRIL